MNDDFIKRVILLDKAEIILKNNKKLNGEHYKRIKSALNKCWIHIWDFEYSDEENKEFYGLFKQKQRSEIE